MDNAFQWHESDIEPPASQKIASAINDCADDLFRAAAYQAFQTPAVALTQIADHIGRSNMADGVNLVDPPEQADFGSARWHAQRIGTGLGMVVPLWGAAKISQFGMNKIGVTRGAFSSSFVAAAEAGGTGLILGAAFTPSETGPDLPLFRAINGITGAASLATFAAVSNTLKIGIPGTEASLGKRVMVGAAGGAAAGLVSAEASALLSNGILIDGKLADSESLINSVYQNAVTGAVLGGLSVFEGKTKTVTEVKNPARLPNVEMSTTYPTGKGIFEQAQALEVTGSIPPRRYTPEPPQKPSSLYDPAEPVPYNQLTMEPGPPHSKSLADLRQVLKIYQSRMAMNENVQGPNQNTKPLTDTQP